MAKEQLYNMYAGFICLQMESSKRFENKFGP